MTTILSKTYDVKAYFSEKKLHIVFSPLIRTLMTPYHINNTIPYYIMPHHTNTILYHSHHTTPRHGHTTPYQTTPHHTIPYNTKYHTIHTTSNTIQYLSPPQRFPYFSVNSFSSPCFFVIFCMTADNYVCARK